MKEYNTKPIPKEEKYVDYDEETTLWCIFGVDSGFAYASFPSEISATLYLKENYN